MTTERFVVREGHLRLLRRAYVRWEDCEYGAPAIDCKRPYGNSDVTADICQIQGWDFGDDGPTREYEEDARLLHEGTETVLQILLHDLTISPGTYEREKYAAEWKRVET